MTDLDVYELYDSNLNMTFDELSRMSGRSRAYLKRLLMGPRPEPETDCVAAYIAEGLGEN